MPAASVGSGASCHERLLVAATFGRGVPGAEATHGGAHARNSWRTVSAAASSYRIPCAIRMRIASDYDGRLMRNRSVTPVWTWERANRALALSTASTDRCPCAGRAPGPDWPAVRRCLPPTAETPDTGTTERLHSCTHAGTKSDGFGLAEDSDAFGYGRVGDPCPPFGNSPFCARRLTTAPVGHRWRSNPGRGYGSGRIGPRCASMSRERAPAAGGQRRQPQPHPSLLEVDRVERLPVPGHHLVVRHVERIERRLEKLHEAGDAADILRRAPRSPSTNAG